MSVAQIRTAIRGSMQKVANIGIVTDFEPVVQREEDLRTYFYDRALGYLLGWSISREATSGADATNMSDFEAHTFVLRGYRAVDNAGGSERAMQDLAEAIRGVLRAEEAGGWNGLVQFVGHPAVRLFEARVFGDVLVHYCELTVVITEHISVP